MDLPLFVCATTATLALLAWGAVTASAVARRVPSVSVPVLPRWARGLILGAVVLASSVWTRPSPAVTPPATERIANRVAATGRAEPGRVRLLSVRRVGPAVDATYVVVRGDSLWAIARRLLSEGGEGPPSSAAIDRLWRGIYARNIDVIGDDPNLIHPGQRLRLTTEE